jgi:hypothetical protein
VAKPQDTLARVTNNQLCASKNADANTKQGAFPRARICEEQNATGEQKGIAKARTVRAVQQPPDRSDHQDAAQRSGRTAHIRIDPVVRNAEICSNQ